jgi:hypothetical protein
MPRSCDCITIAVDDLIKLACTDHQGRVQGERYLLLFEQAPKEIARLSTELSEIYAKHQRKFGHTIRTLRRRIKANPCHTMNSFNGTPSANAGSFPSFGSATPNHQPQPSATNTTETSQPQPFNMNVANGQSYASGIQQLYGQQQFVHQNPPQTPVATARQFANQTPFNMNVASVMAPFNMNAANGQSYASDIQQLYGQQQFVHQNPPQTPVATARQFANQTPIATVAWASPYHQPNAAHVNHG